ncbi:Autophagy-related protein [Lachnellula subtilissima]|uniref:Autophagy-related protein 11 n=1 Tax=Lachnellula subtilissima TaxID=602034 RepID=A0A8H8RVD9_9HELO|nr:Autophagy-related protein [Lachnellula subtilissima]
MALQVLLAHTGQRLQVDPGSFASLEEFKAWVAMNSEVPEQNHIALTNQGKPKDIFVYDRRIAQPSSPGATRSMYPQTPLPPKYTPTKPPDTIANQNDLQAWKDLFKARRTWALKVVDDCAAMSQQVLEKYNESAVITRGIDAAVFNLEKHVRQLDIKNADIQRWSREIQEEQELAGADWEASIARLRSLPATSETIKFITGRDTRRSSRSPTLEDLVDVDDIKRAGKVVQNIQTSLGRDSAKVGKKVDEILKTTDALFEKVETDPARSLTARKTEPIQLMEDIEAIARKVTSDYENVLGYSNTAKNISQASRSALLHTKNYLPNLSKRALEMEGVLLSAIELRNDNAANSLECMRDIATLTAMVSDSNIQFKGLEVDEDSAEAVNVLAMMNYLPVTYASFLAEAVRRREWNEKVKSDSSTLANEMATFQDEEARRRRKWQKSTGSALWGDKAERNVMGLEVNLLGEGDDWPQATRQDLNELLEILKGQDQKSKLLADIIKIMSDLNNPTKQQSKRAKAFKAGSIHEAALGRSALLVRGDDDLIRVLQEEKQKVESKLKTAESRVRRLEDLLHRQSNINRTSTGNVFQLPGYPSPDTQFVANPLASPRLQDGSSRRSSISSRRFSANQGPEEKAFQQKLLSLEAELIVEREKVSGLEKEVSARKTSADNMKSQAEDANSTKQDLMANFEVHQREFIEERKSLEDEIKRLKARLEEVEDEMDRYLGSRENEKATVDERVKAVQDEFDRGYRRSAKITGPSRLLEERRKVTARNQRDLANTDAGNYGKEPRARARIEKAESLANEELKTLQDIHSQLAPKGVIPDTLPALADTLVSLSGDLVAELKSVKSDATIARSDRDTAQTAIVEIQSELEQVKEKVAKEESESLHLRETLDAEKAKFTALEVELTDERFQLTSLRRQIADGETGSDALRNRLEEEERKVTTISEDLAARQSRIGSLEEELRSSQEKHQFIQMKHDKLSSRFEARTLRAKDLTQRVYGQNDRLSRLLERLSYSVTRDGGSMTIQRLPRPEKSTTNDSSDPGSSLKKSISGAVTRKAMVDSGDLDLLYWMHNDDSEAELEKYDAYLNAIGSFDVEAFCEVITRRIKDLEYTAKKYLRDGRAYREKSHAAQKEAHEKIAFKRFKDGDLALFLPTRNQATGAWAAFNVGAPHYFLKEQDSHKLRTRDWLLARIHKIEDRVVDLSKSMSASQQPGDGKSFNSTNSLDDDNPFELSDGLRWYLIDASEEKPGAPSTPGLGKSTVASAHIDAQGSTIRRGKKSSSGGVEKKLTQSLDSRRSSSNSKKAIPLIKGSSSVLDAASLKGASTTGEYEGLAIVPVSSSTPDNNANGEVRNNQIDDLLGP